MKKFIFALLLSTQLLGEQEPLVVGTASGYAPYVSLNTEGRYEGFDIDFAEALAAKLNRKLVIQDCGSMPSLLVALQKKKVDLIIWAVSITEERSQKMEMVYYQGPKVKAMPFLFWKEVPENIVSLQDLGRDPKWAVSAEAGSFQEGVLKKIPEVRLKQVSSVTDALMEIRFGKSKAMAVDPTLVASLTARYPEIKVVMLPLNPGDFSLGNGICINKSNQDLAGQVKEATQQLIAEGQVASLEKKWKLVAP